MKISKEFIEELKSRLDIVSVAQKYLELKKSGRNYFALCPFHKEKTPSFSINPELQIFKCFGCGKSGDVITLVMELENLNYVETVEFLANSVGLTIPQAFEGESDRALKRVRDALSDALYFFRETLKNGREGEVALNYLFKRGIKRETIEFFKIGYAPFGGDKLISFLRKKGYSEGVIEKAGVVSRDKNGKLFDRFRNRIIIPIFDIRGRIVGFGGRDLGDRGPKYLNSPESEFFKKRKLLFGLNFSKDEIKKKNLAILVEGYFDLIYTFQSGVKNLVAPLGTSLTEEQIKLLKRYTDRVVINFDPDAAGIEATKRSLIMFLQNDFDVKILNLQEGLDPDEYIKKYGVEKYRKVLDGAESFMGFLFEYFERKYANFPTPKKKRKIFDEFFPFISSIENELELFSYLVELGEKLGIEKDIIIEDFRRKKKKAYSKTGDLKDEDNKGVLPDISKPERDIIFFTFYFPEESSKILKKFSNNYETFSLFFQSKIMAVVFDFLKKGRKIKLDEVKKELDEENAWLLEEILTGIYLNFSEDDFKNCIEMLRKRRLYEELREVNKEIEVAERKNDILKLKELFEIQKSILNLIWEKNDSRR